MDQNVKKAVFILSMYPVTGLERPLGSRSLRLSEFLDVRHMKVVRLSAVRADHLYPKRYSSYSFMLEAESTPEPCGAGRVKSMKNPSDSIGNRTAILRIVAHCLNQLRCCIHRSVLSSSCIYKGVEGYFWIQTPVGLNLYTHIL
jgi:hypothetical protein